jgi:fumarate reductase subunit C
MARRRRRETHETRDFFIRLAVVFIVILALLYVLNPQGYYAFWNVIGTFFLFFISNPVFIILILILGLIAYLLSRDN